MKTQYITNKLDHFFAIECDINTAVLLGCIKHESLSAMLKYIAAKQDLIADEIESSTFNIRKSDTGYEMTDCRGVWSDIELEGMTLEQWVMCYEL